MTETCVICFRFLSLERNTLMGYSKTLTPSRSLRHIYFGLALGSIFIAALVAGPIPMKAVKAIRLRLQTAFKPRPRPILAQLLTHQLRSAASGRARAP